MNFAFSNIAWDRQLDDSIGSFLQDAGFTGIEIAPTKYWRHPLESTLEERRQIRDFWERKNLPVIAMQSLLFGQDHLHIFKSTTAREKTKEYLNGIILVARDLGCRVLVFGSPKMRQRESLSFEEATHIAAPFFRELGDHAARYGISLCIEPNATEYHCDFITNSDEGGKFVELVGSKGFGLHLDIGCMSMSGEDIPFQFEKWKSLIRHCHLSLPQLETFIASDDLLDKLRPLSGQPIFMSVEMRGSQNLAQMELNIRNSVTSLIPLFSRLSS